MFDRARQRLFDAVIIKCNPVIDLVILRKIKAVESENNKPIIKCRSDHSGKFNCSKYLLERCHDGLHISAVEYVR